jgi:hypothetical protein
MGERCPFCWGQNVAPVGTDPDSRSSRGDDRLVQCQECEKWYWADRQVEVPVLFDHCLTLRLRPGSCYEEVRAIALSGGSGFLRRRIGELNHLCAGCPGGHFERARLPVGAGKAPFSERERTFPPLFK